ncbi:MAG: DUF6602 domain-containing protein [Saprospiraceae bacterium]
MKTPAKIKHEQYMEYCETLLMAQFNVSKLIDHPRWQGDVREEFLMDLVTKLFNGACKLEKGFLYVDADTHDQDMDIFVRRKNAVGHPFGQASGMSPEDTHLIIEVKSTAEKDHLAELNDKIDKIQQQCEQERPYVGMFCYKMGFAKQNMLRWFGYRYDRAGKMYVKDDSLTLEYPFIDFFICIDRTDKAAAANQVFIQKNNQHDGTYILSYNYPLMNDFVRMLQGILNQNMPVAP